MLLRICSKHLTVSSSVEFVFSSLERGLPNKCIMSRLMADLELKNPTAAKKRREQNREAAARCRTKKKVHETELRKRNHQLQTEITERKNRIRHISRQKRDLLDLLTYHFDTCPFTTKEQIAALRGFKEGGNKENEVVVSALVPPPTEEGVCYVTAEDSPGEQCTLVSQVLHIDSNQKESMNFKTRAESEEATANLNNELQYNDQQGCVVREVTENIVLKEEPEDGAQQPPPDTGAESEGSKPRRFRLLYIPDKNELVIIPDKNELVDQCLLDATPGVFGSTAREPEIKSTIASVTPSNSQPVVPPVAGRTTMVPPRDASSGQRQDPMLTTMDFAVDIMRNLAGSA